MRGALFAALLAASCIGQARAQEQEQDPDEPKARAQALPWADSETSAAASGKSKQLTPEALQTLLDRYAHEPSPAQLVAAALRAQQHDPEHFSGMISRARLRGLLPHLDLGARRGQGSDLRWTLTQDLTAHRTTEDDVTLFATLRFDLDRLAFAPEEVSIAREARFARHAHHELVRAVVHVYFLRKRLMLERDLLGSSSIAQQLRIEEAEALLDDFTAGAFQRMLRPSPAAWKTGASTNASERPSPPS